MTDDLPGFACPLPRPETATVQLAHGGGGRLMRMLIDRVFLPAFSNPMLAERHDSAVLEIAGRRFAFTTDSYVVSPLFFPGGDIGKLAVFGTVNDLAMAGARPSFLSAGFILEEGLDMDVLERVVASMRDAAAEAGVVFVTGDTKVVDRGKGDGLFVNTAGIGAVPPGIDVRPSRVRPGDAVVLSGDVGRHGVAILSVREGIRFATPLVSDCAPLAQAVRALLESGVDVHCLRDLTRGGLATGLNEIAADARVRITLEEGAVPVTEAVSAACELLGLDPLYVANEGRFVAFVPACDTGKAVDALRRQAVTAEAACVGSVAESSAGEVVLKGTLGGARTLDLLSGEQLPRIC
jgi:hydrogenase expression/formation protein HypE